ncbi:hypothetical protein [Vibrio amylolyticus]|uniref:hypothetical protein n=1 Tax=Vibrio amylolyticus TaxID=2847292 RepID=UPI00354C5B75
MFLSERRAIDITYTDSHGEETCCNILAVPAYELYHATWTVEGKTKGMHFAWSPEEEILIDHGLLPIGIRERMTEAILNRRKQVRELIE